MSEFKSEIPYDSCDYCKIIVNAIANNTPGYAKEGHLLLSEREYGVNEIVNLVSPKIPKTKEERRMNPKTAIKHIHDLLKLGILVDANEDSLTNYLRIISRLVKEGTMNEDYPDIRIADKTNPKGYTTVSKLFLESIRRKRKLRLRLFDLDRSKLLAQNGDWALLMD